MELVISLLVGALLFCLIYWCIEVHLPRIRAREQKAEAITLDRIRIMAESADAWLTARFPPSPKRVAVKKTPGRVARVPHA